MCSVLYVGTWTLHCVLRQKIDVVVCISLIWFPMYVLRHRLCLNLDIHQSARLNSQQAVGNPTVSVSPELELQLYTTVSIFFSVWTLKIELSTLGVSCKLFTGHAISAMLFNFIKAPFCWVFSGWYHPHTTMRSISYHVLPNSNHVINSYKRLSVVNNSSWILNHYLFIEGILGMRKTAVRFISSACSIVYIGK